MIVLRSPMGARGESRSSKSPRGSASAIKTVYASWPGTEK
jgi:hypothetical protein